MVQFDSNVLWTFHWPYLSCCKTEASAVSPLFICYKNPVLVLTFRCMIINILSGFILSYYFIYCSFSSYHSLHEHNVPVRCDCGSVVIVKSVIVNIPNESVYSDGQKRPTGSRASPFCNLLELVNLNYASSSCPNRISRGCCTPFHLLISTCHFPLCPWMWCYGILHQKDVSAVGLADIWIHNTFKLCKNLRFHIFMTFHENVSTFSPTIFMQNLIFHCCTEIAYMYVFNIHTFTFVQILTNVLIVSLV